MRSFEAIRCNSAYQRIEQPSGNSSRSGDDRWRRHELVDLPSSGASPEVSELLDVDREYREKAAEGQLQRITPRRFNPMREAWLPILHTRRGSRHYTALFSNSARAHQAGKTRDWVVLYSDNGSGDMRHTVITAMFEPLRGRRVVAGREAECQAYYAECESTSHQRRVAL
jgi:putative hydrolase